MSESLSCGAFVGVERRTGTGTAPGTFGELLQGVLPDGRHFLVTLPITRGTSAEFRWEPDTTGLTVVPDDRHKAARLTARMFERFAAPGGGVLTLRSDLLPGKGMASSSADLVASARAVGDALGISLRSRDIEDLLRGIEPSDGVMHPGAVAFYHREVRLRERLGELPPLTIVGIDEGDEIDTIAFNRITHQFPASERAAYAALLDTLGAAVRARDVSTIGQVATASALRNQRLCPKRMLEPLVGVCEDVGGAGIAAAHSGTVLGILLDERDPAYPDRLAAAVRACTELGTVSIDHTGRPAGARTGRA
ncbi:hypothetical protein [Kibdelosporangium phytohabitans]|uniref:Uncharacterized protein n=1 Tax=Kibdelosporangium phytohabitans TaxID=860235 RepID=A0A0N9I1S7_9PSEU|nr:hypothetical protein [Kibdelosporangium phytohabitans]ALG12492.1 hypothetical protein AOZ06_41540 [Kibdelosporangium phytohabitans]MBE1464089.1 L-threonine kinase [Kibdelosporangium phytohabitans]